MRHRIAKSKINRFTSWRYATLRSLVKSLLVQQSIRTTKKRARLAQALAERLISLGKSDTLAAKRRAYKILQDHKLVSYLFNDIAKRFTEKSSGFTRILNLGVRRGDNASLAVLELTEIKKKEKRKSAKEKEIKPQAEAAPPAEEKKPEAKTKVLERPPISKKPTKKFLGGLRGIFKKERDSL